MRQMMIRAALVAGLLGLLWYQPVLDYFFGASAGTTSPTPHTEPPIRVRNG